MVSSATLGQSSRWQALRGSPKYLHLVWTQYVVSLRMWPTWASDWHGFLRMFSRYILCVIRRWIGGTHWQSTVVFHPCIRRSLPPCAWLKCSTPPILTLRMACAGQASNAHRWFACTPPTVLMVSWWSAAPFSTRHVWKVSYSWITHKSGTAAEEGNGWAQCWPTKERSMFNLASKKNQSWHLQVPCPWRLCHHDQDVWDDWLVHHPGRKWTSGFFVSFTIPMLEQGELAYRQIKKMYGLSNKKGVNEQFMKQEHHCTLLRRQQEQDQLANVVDPSLTLHHSMARQARKDNVFSISWFLVDHIDDPAIKGSDSDWCVCVVHADIPHSPISSRA